MENDREGQFERPLDQSQELDVSYVYDEGEDDLEEERMWGKPEEETLEEETSSPDFAGTRRLDIYKSLAVSDLVEEETDFGTLPEECIIEQEFMLERARVEEALTRAANLELVLSVLIRLLESSAS